MWFCFVLIEARDSCFWWGLGIWGRVVGFVVFLWIELLMDLEFFSGVEILVC